MDLVNVLHMNAGTSECSYANSSVFQKYVILKSLRFLEDAVKDYGTHGFPECFKLADLGCSSGANTFLFVANVLSIVHAVCLEKNLKAPEEFQVFLNDLPNNDFNELFKMTPQFFSKLEKSINCFVCGVPGSFYTRLFPSKSLHFVHSSYGLHWLSQVPEKLLDNNKGNIYIAKASPPRVYDAYFDQFNRDLTTFLQMRSEEIIPGGRMVLTLIGRSIADPTSKDCCSIYELLAKSLHDLVVEGLLHEEGINSFNIPIYHPCADELKTVIGSESSFRLDKLETFEVDWDVRDANDIRSEDDSGKFIAKTERAVMEPLFAGHFGNTFMDKIFDRFAMHVTEHFSAEKTKTKYLTITLSLTRK
ncbi:salicylate carboxymethyltransferase-like [Heracleum sosnowskyi]|uniref:Salicylate carboxymethyltransferase-like n=1 Tax=Heracleum sosnowskyi TaxID=360622 RepID=A0AAD8IMI5_9APIA|nr:salicylate carboxymethyltransferase-like [Heracleum sosnowskyi]